MSNNTSQNRPIDLEKGLEELDRPETHVENRDVIENDKDLVSTPSRQQNTITKTQSRTAHSIKVTSTKLSKILTARSNASVIDPGPPPDGGLKAWTQALMGHLVILNTWGMISSFSVFQAYYTSELGMEPSAVSWIGSIQMLGHFGLGLLTGRMLDGGLFYWAVIPGVILTSLSMFLTSLCDKYYQLFLAQGVLFGIGCGLQFTPASSLVYTYFSSNKAVALAIVASGSATGGLIYPTIARQLLPKLGFGWTTRIMAFMMLAMGTCYCSLLKPRLPPRKSGPLFELSAFRELPYLLYNIGVFLTLMGQYFGFYYIGSFGLNVIGVPYSTSVNVLMIMNGVGLAGRLIPGYLADQKFGCFNTLIPFVFASGIIMYCWSAVNSEAGLYAWAVVYGFASAGFQGLFPSSLGTLTKDLSKLGVRNGQGFGIAGVAALIGPPIAGALIQQSGGSYLASQMWSASMIVGGGVMFVLARISKTGLVLRVRV